MILGQNGPTILKIPQPTDTNISIPTPIFFYLGTPSTAVPTSNPSCSTSSAVANASDLQLTDREKARLDELFMASRALVEPVEHERDVRNSIFYISSVGQG